MFSISRGLTAILLITSLVSATSCNNSTEIQPDENERIFKAIESTRNKFWMHARKGDVDSMLNMHLDSPSYRLYENGKAYTYQQQVEGHGELKRQQLAGIDFKVNINDFRILNNETVMETWDGVTISRTKDNRVDTSGKFYVTIIYRKTTGGWKFHYLHSSNELPKP